MAPHPNRPSQWSRLSGLPLWRAATARSLWARAADHPVRRALPLPSTHATSRYFTPLPLAMLNIVLVHPEIPPNTGNAIRLCANTGFALHLVEPLGFSMDDKHMRRAGLDYHEYAQVQRHTSWSSFLATAQPDPARLFALTTRGTRWVQQATFARGDWLVFGSETAGLPADIREHMPSAQWLRLPMRSGQRSLNLSNAVAVAGFEAWRQMGFEGAV